MPCQHFEGCHVLACPVWSVSSGQTAISFLTPHFLVRVCRERGGTAEEVSEFLPCGMWVTGTDGADGLVMTDRNLSSPLFISFLWFPRTLSTVLSYVDLPHELGDCLHARGTHLPPFSSIRRFLTDLNSGRCTGDSSQQDVIKVKAFSGTSSSCGM